MPTLIARIANTLVLQFIMIFKSSFADRLIFTLIARKTNTSVVRLYMTFKTISGGYLMHTLMAGIANNLMLRFCMFLTLHRVIKKIFTPSCLRC